MPDLRPYQQTDVSSLRETLKTGAKRVLFEASVGYGKSVVIEHLADAYSAAGRRVWVLSNRSAVVDMLRRKAGSLPGVSVMTVQAADRRRDRLAADPAALILVDEVHMGGAAAQYRRVLDCSPGAVAVGFTGTPRPETFEVFPAHVAGRDAAWLTQQGFLAPLRYLCPDPLDMRNVRKVRGEYDEAQVLEALANKKIYSNAIESYRTHAIGAPTLGFCVNVQHAMDTASEFRTAGHACDVLTGKDRQEEVERKIASLADGGLLFSVDKVSAGFDLPDLRNLLHLRPTASEQLWVQQLGRAARASEGKTHGLVLDHVGNTLRLGTLTEHRDWRNLEDKKEQIETEAGEKISVRQCEDCMSVFEAGPKECPSCGASLAKETRIPRAEAVRLRELDAEEAARLRAAAQKQRRREESEPETLQDWLALAAARGYKPGWARMRYQLRQKRRAS